MSSYFETQGDTEASVWNFAGPWQGGRNMAELNTGSESFCLETTLTTAMVFPLVETNYTTLPYVIGTRKYNLPIGRGSKYLRVIMQSAMVLSKYLLIKQLYAINNQVPMYSPIPATEVSLSE